MTLRENICASASPSTVNKGKALAEKEKNFRNKSVKYADGIAEIEGLVVSYQGWNSPYYTWVQIDEDEEEIVRHSCGCIAHETYYGPCKHCIGLALSYDKRPETFTGHKSGVKKTSASISDLLKSNRNAESATSFSTIHICPYINYEEGWGWSVRFKITDGVEKEYSIMSVSNFVDLVQNSKYHKYGKYLAFKHELSTFDKSSQSLIAFMENLVDARKNAYSIAHYKSYYNYNTSGFKIGREIELSNSETIQLFKALKGAEFPISINKIQHRSNLNLTVKEEDPKLKLTLNKANDGYEISLDKKFFKVASGSEMFIFISGDAVYECSKELSANNEFLECLQDDDENSTPFISNEDMPTFCAIVMPTLDKGLQVDAPKEIMEMKPAECEIEFYFDNQDEIVSVNTVAKYGTHAIPLVGFLPHSFSEPSVNNLRIVRNTKVEALAKSLTEKYFGQEKNTLTTHEDLSRIGELTENGIKEFAEAGEVFSTEAFDKLMGKRNASVNVDASVYKNILMLNISSSQLNNNEINEILKSYRQKRKYHLLSTGAIVNVEELELDELDKVSNDFNLTQKDIKHGSVEIPKYLSFYINSLKGVSKDDSFREYIKTLKGIEKQKEPVPESLANTLRSYQSEGFRWLSNRCKAGFGGILADEMGLGKSLQLITLLLAKREEATSPSLIICPSSLVYNWKAEFERFAPQLNVQIATGPASTRKVAIEKSFIKWKKKSNKCVDVFVTSYDLARIDAECLSTHNFNFLVLDEAQYIKNSNAQTTKAVKSIPAEHRFALTGTPIENRLTELWSIFDFLMPGLLGNKTRFKSDFEKPIVYGDELAQEKLHNLISPFILRRLKSDVLRDLPAKLENIVYAEMDEKQKKVYEAYEKRLALMLQTKNADEQEGAKEDAGISRIKILSELTKLRQVCCDPRLLIGDYETPGCKIETINALIEQAIDSEQKVLLFSQFTTYLDLIAKNLDENKIKHYSITGKTPKKERLNLVNKFNENDVPVFLISLKAGGTGLNLTGASIVIHADPWWNDAAQQQATDRAHRIGQTKVVNVQKVIVKDTIEERIVKLQEKKRSLSDKLVQSGSTSLSSLSEQDLVSLLSLQT